MTITLRDGISTATLDDGMVLLDERTGRYWQLNGTGTLIMAALVGGASTAQTGQQLRRQHPHLSVDQADQDVAALLASLRAAGLVTS